MVLYNGTYWHFFGRGGGSMYFVTANQPEGPWSEPTKMTVPAGMSGLGVDNSIFIDDETGKWYLLTKNGPENNHIVELGEDGQPTGVVLDLTWLSPDSLDNPYGWAEGPVMWKFGGYYYYSFVRHLGGSQCVMRSDTLTADSASWEMLDLFFDQDDPRKPGALFTEPNHTSPVVMLDDSTHWVIHPLYAKGEWIGPGAIGTFKPGSL